MFLEYLINEQVNINDQNLNVLISENIPKL